MARLCDPSKMPGSYSLEALSKDMADDIEKTKKTIVETLMKEYMLNESKNNHQI
jgi:hypothetical protein